MILDRGDLKCEGALAMGPRANASGVPVISHAASYDFNAVQEDQTYFSLVLRRHVWREETVEKSGTEVCF